MAGNRISRGSWVLVGLIGAVAAVRADSVNGKVLDAAHSPIAGAHVTAAGNLSATTNERGEFTLDLPTGSNTLKIAADGFSDLSETLQVPGGAEPKEFVLQVAASKYAITVTEAGNYRQEVIRSGTKTLTPLRDVPQSVTIITQELMHDQMMMSIGDVVRYVPGVTSHQGENNRDQVVIRGNNSSADFFIDGVRDDVQYYRDLYNLDRVEVLKGSNAMIFGRGGGGGVINRVAKEAMFMPLREIELQGGSFGNKRFSTDLDEPLSKWAALRFNGMYENSDSFRTGVNLQRYGISPTLTLLAGKNTKITLSYENFHDRRVADRGIPSFQGRPLDIPVETYFGDPNNSRVQAKVNLGSAVIEHQMGRFTLRNRTQFGAYDRGYQNFVPGVVSADKTQDSLSAYNNATKRLNVFNQTDLTFSIRTGRVRHDLLVGVEAGRQLTDNFRNTGFFNNTATSILVPLSATVITTPVVFRQSATDADNHLKTNLGAGYVQDQIALSKYVQVIAGLRFDHFDLQYHDNRSGSNLRRIDNLVSPRAGIVFKPITPLSIYTSYSVSYLPSSGDQFSSLTTITQQVKPERFNNYEVGVKWDLAANLSLTTAVYRLDRTNTRSTDPTDPTRIVQTGSQRTNGYELGLNGNITRRWSVAGGYAYQDAFISSATTSAFAGAQVAMVPHHTFSLWNHYRIRAKLGAGIGILHQADMFAAVDNTVTLPGYTRADAAVYYSFTDRMRLQMNVENLAGEKYYINADGNNNISPGSPRAVRLALTTRF